MVVLDRAGAFIDYITASWELLTTISAVGFGEFRDTLSTASGQLSFMYRHVEFILGNKNEALASAHDNVPHVWPGMAQALHSPSLYDAAIAYLARQGHPIDASMLERDWSKPYEPNESVLAAWREVYADPEATNEAYRLGEMLIALDEKFSLYRWRHFTAVEKIIGFKAGTGGSSGVAWLQHVTTLRFFPELWALRTEL